jgi:hypothetical protein
MCKGGLKVIAAQILEVDHRKEDIVPSRPDRRKSK